MVVRVVSPALDSPLHHWTSDEDGARAEAQRRLHAVLAELAGVGIPARGDVGADDPLQAIDDELRIFPAGEIVLVTRSDGPSCWLEEGLPERARRRYDLPVTHLASRDRAELHAQDAAEVE